MNASNQSDSLDWGLESSIREQRNVDVLPYNTKGKSGAEGFTKSYATQPHFLDRIRFTRAAEQFFGFSQPPYEHYISKGYIFSSEYWERGSYVVKSGRTIRPLSLTQVISE